MTGSIAQAGDTVLLISEEGKRFYTCLQPERRQHTHHGILEHDAIIGQPLGQVVTTNIGRRYAVVEPSVSELMKEVRRNTQIIYPKEAGRIVFKLNIYAGRRVIEAGTGSGALTVALARYVAPTGRVYSYETRPEMRANAHTNLEKAGLAEYVDFKLRNISLGFEETNVDTVFLDVKEPWRYLPQVKAALKPSGFFGVIVPTTNQVTELLLALRLNDFAGIEVEELLLRRYKAIPGRLRPQDMMVGHTGYLIFARNLDADLIPESTKYKRRSAREKNDGHQSDIPQD